MNPAIGNEGKHLYEFGPFRLDPAERVLVRNGERVSLAPKAFETLFIFVQHSGHALTKDELIKNLWPDSFVEENNLTQQISQLRRALGEGSNGQTYIETVPKLGYRFIPQVRVIVDGDGDVVVSRRTRTHIVLREEEVQEEEDSVEDPAGTGATQNLAKVASQAMTAPAVFRGPVTISLGLKLIAVSLAVIVTIVAGVFSYRRLRPSRNAQPAPTVAPISALTPLKPRYSVLVLGFRNLSGRTDDDWLSLALAEMLTTELASGGQLRIVSGEEAQRIKSDFKLQDEQRLAKPMLNQIRNRVGADMIVSGAFVQIGREPKSQLRLDLQLQDVEAGETVFSTAVTGTSQQLFALVSRSGSQLRSKLGVPMLSDMEGAQDQAAMPSTPEVARLYSQGLSRLRLSDAPAAEKLLAKAVAIDSHFALGHSALASAWSALGYDEKA
jgi:DNA-binding winged helix-turn-helix (wHTH) protein/TolB-like protein